MPSANAQAWLDDFFRAYYVHRPVNATFIGVHEYDHRLPDCTDAGLGDLKAGMEGLLARLPRLDGERNAPGAPHPAPGGADPAVEAIDLRLARGFLELQLWELESGHFQRGNPSWYAGEAVFGVLSLFLSDFAPLPERLASAVQRLEATPAFLAQAREQLGRSAGCPPPWRARALDECRGALAFLGDGVEALCVDVAGAADPGPSAAALVPAFRRAAATAAAAFGEFRTWLETTLPTDPSAPAGCGPEILDLHIRAGHALPERAAEIAAYARDEIEAGRSWLQAHAGDFGADSAAEALAGLADAHPTAGEYLERYRTTWDACRELARERALVTWPDAPIRYVPRPRWARAAAPWLYFLFYRAPAAFRRPPVHDYLVAPLPEDADAERLEAFLRSNHDGAIKTNHVIHHGGLGHHVQNGHAHRAPSRVGRVAAVDCASRIAMHCGGTMAEGWACYATDVMREAGALTPLEAYAERQSRVRMACRAVVDVELHSGRMDLDEATEFYRAHAGMPEASARSEATKNSMFPGGALMYLMGTDHLHRIRREVEALEGNRFTLRSFHDRFLSWGSIPVTLAGRLLLDQVRTGPPTSTPGHPGLHGAVP